VWMIVSLAACDVHETAPPAAETPAASSTPIAVPAPAPAPPAAPPVDPGVGLGNGATAPDFDLAIHGGSGTWRLYDHVAPDATGTSSAAIVSFSASWCGPCRASLPTLAEIAAANPGLTIVIVSIDANDADREKERAAVASAGLSAPVLSADSSTRRAWLGSEEHIPRFFFLNKIAEVMVQDRGFGDKVRPMMPKQVAYILAHPEYVQRDP
jgi:thiol-disulfide isomerase/thioredoxin